MIIFSRTKPLFWTVLIVVLTLLTLRSTDVGAEGSGPLHRDGVIYGVVVNQYGAPLQNVQVLVRKVNFEDGYFGGAWTDWQGRFRLENIAHGEYILLFEEQTDTYAKMFSGNVPDARNAQTFTVSSSQPIQINAQMQLGSTISGQVRWRLDTLGESTDVWQAIYRWDGVEWAEYGWVSRYDARMPYRFEVKGLAAGQYRLETMAGPYWFRIASFYPNSPTLAGAETITLGQNQTLNLPTTIDLMADSTLGGRVTDAATGRPLSSVSVSLYQLNRKGGHWMQIDSLTTDQNGRYAFVNLDPDNYKLGFDSYGDERYVTVYNGNQPTLGAAPHITLAAGQQITDQDMALQFGGELRGIVRLADGTAVDQVTAKAYRYNGAGEWLETSYDFAWYDEGQFSLKALPTGHYRVRFDVSIGGLGDMVFWYGGAKVLDDAQVIDVVVGESYDIDVVIPTGEVTIFGTVRDKVWNRLPDMPVEIYRLVQHEDRTRDYWVHVVTTLTDADGQYYVDGLLPGGYTVSVFDTTDTYIDTYLGGKFTLAESIGFEMANGGVRSADLFMPRASSIAGRVTLQEGTLDWGRVVLLPLDSTDPAPHYYRSRGVNLERNGEYQLNDVAEGSYRLYFEAWTRGERAMRTFAYSGGVEFAEQATVIHVSEGQVLTEVSAELGSFYFHETVSENSVSGRVTDGSAPLSGIEVHLYQRTYFRSSYYWPESSIMVVTGANGEFHFGDLYGGEYRVGFYDPSGNYVTQYYDAGTQYSQATTIYLGGGTHRTDINAALVRMPLSNVR